ncbi:exported hypothetical protein [Pseudoclavibacter sp. 8L]|nr:exported hypothetical protein [Pseudoclavibacter sp. 8L]
MSKSPSACRSCPRCGASSSRGTRGPGCCVGRSPRGWRGSSRSPAAPRRWPTSSDASPLADATSTRRSPRMRSPTNAAPSPTESSTCCGPGSGARRSRRSPAPCTSPPAPSATTCHRRSGSSPCRPGSRRPSWPASAAGSSAAGSARRSGHPPPRLGMAYTHADGLHPIPKRGTHPETATSPRRTRTREGRFAEPRPLPRPLPTPPRLGMAYTHADGLQPVPKRGTHPETATSPRRTRTRTREDRFAEPRPLPRPLPLPLATPPRFGMAYTHADELQPIPKRGTHPEVDGRAV